MGEKNFPSVTFPDERKRLLVQEKPDRLTPSGLPPVDPTPRRTPLLRPFLSVGGEEVFSKPARGEELASEFGPSNRTRRCRGSLWSSSPSGISKPHHHPYQVLPLVSPQSSFSFLAGFLTSFLNFLAVCLLQQHRSPRISTRPSCPAWVSTRSLWVPCNEHCLCEFV